MSLSKDIYNHLIKQLLPQMEFLKLRCEEELRRIIWEFVYQKYDPEVYVRTYELLNSVTSSDVSFNGSTISFRVYLDPEKMHHKSIAGEEAKGISPGEEIYVVPLVENSHGGLFFREGTPFMNQYIQEIQEDLNKAMIKYIIKKFNKNTYKK